MQTIIISYYTDFPGSDNFYRSCAETLVDNCEKVGARYSISEVEGFDDWMNNTRLKPSFIKRVLEYVQEPVLFIDVDSKIHRPPKIVDQLPSYYDMAVVPKKHEPQKTCGYRLHSQLGTLWFNHSFKAFNFLDLWEEKCFADTSPKTAHQLFASAWQELKLPDYLNLFYLPESYGYIRQRPDHKNIEPIIEMKLSSSKSKKEALRRLK